MTDSTTIGDVTVGFRNDPNSFYWTIHDFVQLAETMVTNEFYCSPKIRYLDDVWKLCIYPRGTDFHPDCVLLQVWRKGDSFMKPVRLCLSTFYLGEKTQFCSERCDSDDSFFPNHFYFVKRFECLDKKHIYLCIVFSLSIDETSPVERKFVSSEAQTEDLPCARISETCKHLDVKDESTLCKHLEDMLLSGNDHDVTIKVKDQQFRAHKGMLRARSPVFAAMFKHKMKESTDNSISIDDCDPESFSEFLYYVYTEKVKNLSLNNVMGLYYAGDKYEFSGLKKICVEFLKTSLSTTVICDVISLAVKHSEDELLKCATSFFAEHLEEIMITVEWQRFALDNPIQANEISLKACKCRLHKK